MNDCRKSDIRPGGLLTTHGVACRKSNVPMSSFGQTAVLRNFDPEAFGRVIYYHLDYRGVCGGKLIEANRHVASSAKRDDLAPCGTGGF
ncbi:hypothetical protein FVER14953_21618 [Fusarium verticillioides]|nr:hypothetical protein FVER14953_21618 [Fusarium verticillioides]RBQ88418.1 hypothetical protein FVER53263_21144 [Fusarium verticillioides]